MKNNASTHFAQQQAVCLWLRLHQEQKIFNITQTDLIGQMHAKHGTFKKMQHIRSDEV